MTKNERQAALDALAGLIGQDSADASELQAGNSPTIPQAFADAWNRIMTKYDNENTTIEDLADLLYKIKSGELVVLDD